MHTLSVQLRLTSPRTAAQACTGWQQRTTLSTHAAAAKLESIYAMRISCDLLFLLHAQLHIQNDAMWEKEAKENEPSIVHSKHVLEGAPAYACASVCICDYSFDSSSIKTERRTCQPRFIYIHIYIYIYTFFFFSPRLKNETGEATIVGAVLWRSTTLQKKKKKKKCLNKSGSSWALHRKTKPTANKHDRR